MRSINKVILIGNVTRDPIIKETKSGKPVAIFGLATNREWSDKADVRKTSTEFHEVVAWAKVAELCQKYVTKGKLLYIEGYLKTRQIVTPEGITKYKKEIIIEDLIMLDRRPREEVKPAN